MFNIKLADIVVRIDAKYGYLEEMCKDYITDEKNADISVFVTDEEIEKEKINLSEEFSNDYIESICAYRKICVDLPKYDAFVMHSAVVEVDGKAYAFTAKSGTGKTTHIGLWKKYLKDRVHIVNGDKPILRFENGKLYVYGTPWCGKEGWQRNVKTELKAICFIERDSVNHIEKLSKDKSAERMMRQILLPKDAFGAVKTLELVDEMLKITDTWLLWCNISEESAKIAYEAMSQGE